MVMLAMCSIALTLRTEASSASVPLGRYCFTGGTPKLKAAGITVSFDFSDDSTDEVLRADCSYVDFAFFSAADAASEDSSRASGMGEGSRSAFRIGNGWR